jgi:hypothetical protein
VLPQLVLLVLQMVCWALQALLLLLVALQELQVAWVELGRWGEAPCQVWGAGAALLGALAAPAAPVAAPDPLAALVPAAVAAAAPVAALVLVAAALAVAAAVAELVVVRVLWLVHHWVAELASHWVAKLASHWVAWAQAQLAGRDLWRDTQGGAAHTAFRTWTSVGRGLYMWHTNLQGCGLFHTTCRQDRDHRVFWMLSPKLRGGKKENPCVTDMLAGGYCRSRLAAGVSSSTYTTKQGPPTGRLVCCGGFQALGFDLPGVAATRASRTQAGNCLLLRKSP